MRRANPRSYDEYLKAYSMAMLPRAERENVSYGGKSTRHLISLPDVSLGLSSFLRSYTSTICTCKLDKP